MMRPRMLLAPNPSPMTLDGTRTFLVGVERPAVIDPGPAIEAHLRVITAALDGRPPVILLTHSHPDHADAAPELARRTGGQILAYPEIGEGSRIETDAGGLEVLETPGHAPDHLAFRLGEALFVGDAFMGGMDTVLIAPPEGDLADYLRTLDRVEALAPAILHPAHGEPIPDGEAAARRYREHRMQRVAQVEAALRERGPAAPAALVAAIYGDDLHPDLGWAAAASVSASAEYLAARGRARQRADGRFEAV